MRDKKSALQLSVSKWAAWAPGIQEQADWQAWAKGDATISGPVNPDVKFVAPMMRRRLSGLSRMAFRVAADCLEGTTEAESPTFVFCSRYGEYERSYGILEGIAAGNPASAAAFSMSVHNTATSLFSIETGNRAPSIALAGGEATLENGFLEAWSLLSTQSASSVLLIYHDERLPDLYRGQKTTVNCDCALAMILKASGNDPDATQMTLEWNSRNPTIPSTPETQSDPALQVLRLLINGTGMLESDTGRLVWTWKADHGAD